MFFTSFVNQYQTQLLIDTGATTTFVHSRLLDKLSPSLSIRPNPYSFFLADGRAPFHVLGTVDLSITFADVTTHVTAHVAQHLCTDIILGMDYINAHNLTIDTKRQLISIDHNNRTLIVPIDPHTSLNNVSVLASQSILIPPLDTHCEPVPAPGSSFLPPDTPPSSTLHDTLPVENTVHLNLTHHCSSIAFSNTSPTSIHLSTNSCVGVLFSPSLTPTTSNSLIAPHSSVETTGFSGDAPVLSDANANEPISSPVRTSPLCHITSFVVPQLPDHIHSLIKHINNIHQRSRLSSLLSNFSNTFATSKHNIASTPIHHVIHTVPHVPPASRPYPQPTTDEPMYNLIQEFLTAGLISESHSPYAAPALLVKKKDNSYRFVVDYKKLNLITIKDSSPLPNMEDAIRKLGHGYSYFSKLDLKSGFYQIPINPSDKAKTAFITPFGLYQFNVLPMGLKNSPPTFQKVMNDTLKSCRSFSLVYLDDIIVFSDSFDDHLYHLERVLSCLKMRSLILNPPKCVLAAQEIDYLGHTISQTRVTPMREKIEAILKIPEPKTLAQANQFIGALSWYRKFLPQFATVAAPIHSVTNLTKANRRNFKWLRAQSLAFYRLQQMLINEPLFLHYPISDVPLILSTDASNLGIGGVLQQEVNGELRNLYYHSQLMTHCERKYSAIEKEALAIYKCFARMRTFLLGRTIILKTDHCPLCHIMEKTVRNARVDRITHLIQEYNIEKVVHIRGRENCLPDFLSRYSNEYNDDLNDVEYGLESKEPLSYDKTIPTISSNLSPRNTTDNHPTLTTMILRPRPVKTRPPSDANEGHRCSPIDDQFSTNSPSTNRHLFARNRFDPSQIPSEQRLDPFLRGIIERIHTNPTNTSFVIKENLLHRIVSPATRSKQNSTVICLPSSMITSLLEAFHDDPLTGSHFSLDRTYHKIKRYYWWPQMKTTIQKYIDACVLCKQYNISRKKPHGHLQPISPPDGPFQMIGIDFCGPLKPTPRENQYVLVITDYFTRHITAVALPNCSAEITAQTLFNEFFCKYGIPVTLLSDRGSHFHNHLMNHLQHLIGYNHIYSTSYHPQTNGMVERFNATFIPQISKLQDAEQNNWDAYLPAVVFAYNTGIHKTTQYSPYELLYGRQPRLPTSQRSSHLSFSSPVNYLAQLQKTLKIYHQATRHHILAHQTKYKHSYDRNRQNPRLNVGDRVLTRIRGTRGKLDPRFSSIPTIIVQVNHPIYLVQDEETNEVNQFHIADLRPLLLS